MTKRPRPGFAVTPFGAAASLLSAACVIGSLSACASRGFNASDSGVRNIPFGKSPTKFRVNGGDEKASITCPVRHSSKQRDLGGVNRIYKSSAEVDYLSPGWENRIAFDKAFFTATNAGQESSSPSSAGNTHSLVVIDIRTVDGVPYYHYYGNPNWNAATETWSSSKMIGVGMFLHKLRTATDGAVGGDATFAGGSIRDDMDRINDESSNSHAGWYKALAGTNFTNNMLDNWLYRSGDEYAGFHGFGGGGEWDKTVSFTSPKGQKSPPITPDWQGRGNNSLSMLTQAEYMKRVGVNFRDPIQLPRMGSYNTPRSASALAAAQPSWTVADVYTLMYGDYPKGGLGGMMYDGMRDVPRMFTINGENPSVPDHSGIEKISGGNWVSVGKGGSGASDSRSKKEEILMNYICIPSVNGGEGVEFVIAQRTSTPLGGDPLTRGWRSYGKVIDTMYPGIRSGKAIADSGPSWTNESGEAKSKVDTLLKRSPRDSSALSDAEKCKFPAGNVLGYDAKIVEGSHTRLKLKFADAACKDFGTDVYVFTDHFEIMKK